MLAASKSLSVMIELIRGAIYGVSFFVASAAAWNAFVLGHMVVAVIASRFPIVTVFLLPFCYLVPCFIVSATVYLIIQDMRRAKQ